jgi:SAM-dependent methyltransferase
MSPPDEPFYGVEGLNVSAYDAYSAGTATSVFQGDVEFFADVARSRGGEVLDLACGTGRVTWPLAAMGFPVTGLDRSGPMLARAEAKRAGAHAEVARRVRFVHGDMTSFGLGRTFGAIVVPFRSFHFLLTPQDQRRALAAMREHLAPQGRLVLDLFDPRLDLCHPALDESRRERAEVVLPGTDHRLRVGVDWRRNDHMTQVLTESWRFTEVDAAGKVVREETETLRLRWTYRHELRHLLELEGLAVEAEYSDFRRSPPAYGKGMVLVVRRAAE